MEWLIYFGIVCLLSFGLFIYVRYIKLKNDKEIQNIRQKIKGTAFEHDFKRQIRFNKFYKAYKLFSYFKLNKDKSEIKPSYTYK